MTSAGFLLILPDRVLTVGDAGFMTGLEIFGAFEIFSIFSLSGIGSFGMTSESSLFDDDNYYLLLIGGFTSSSSSLSFSSI